MCCLYLFSEPVSILYTALYLLRFLNSQGWIASMFALYLSHKAGSWTRCLSPLLRSYQTLLALQYVSYICSNPKDYHQYQYGVLSAVPSENNTDAVWMSPALETWPRELAISDLLDAFAVPQLQN
jgi:hypothetical protein